MYRRVIRGELGDTHRKPRGDDTEETQFEQKKPNLL